MIYYLCPDYDVPSWGVGILYHHVFFLQKHGIDACILHYKRGFKLSWLKLDVQVRYRDNGFKPVATDLLIVPDIFVEERFFKALICRKFLFVQNAFIFFEKLKDLKIVDLQFEGIFYYMPHLQSVLSKYFKIPLIETPTFVADYYSQDPNSTHERKRRILIYPKFNSKDYTILENLLSYYFKFEKDNLISKIIRPRDSQDWVVKIVSGYGHAEVAKLMKESMFFVNINTHEAFNSSVPEAMAAGCINFTYNAYGPADFLVDEKNSFVFPNNSVFELFQKLRYYIVHFEDPENVAHLSKIRLEAFETAREFSILKAEAKMVHLMKGIVSHE